MDSIEQRLKEQLETITFSDDDRKRMIRRVKEEAPKKRVSYVWRYRTVLVAAILLAVVLAGIGLQSPSSPKSHQAAGSTTEQLIQLLGYDSVKTVLLVLLFVSVYALLKWNLKKQRQGLPVCPNCGTVWSRRLALKKFWRGKKVDCPHCGTANYQTKKSRWKTALFNLFIPLLIPVSNLFDASLYGTLVFLGLYFIFMTVLIPYYVDLQLDDPDKEPLW
ncbi:MULTISPECIES: TIGR04104 family putative zinc finger protein [Sporosarcina]|uniref:TIGR04104 family putative zinc finger protein n=1 Tax=Sporosarcina TaxID=1569 RepID=UPI000694593F|nr:MULTISPECIES: TIGR04104 family putative zinc finger protein [Sporosarcina]WJY27595.1 hypothetical protein QWT68_00830 [Sporosarcina sp. 0.2-SM1T-5]